MELHKVTSLMPAEEHFCFRDNVRLDHVNEKTRGASDDTFFKKKAD